MNSLENTVKTQTIEMDRAKARELWRDYRKHQHYSKPIDQDVMRTYQAIAQGKVVIRALDSIATAGLDEDGLPKLAIARADQAWCWCQGEQDGGALFTTHADAIWSWGGNRFARHSVRFPAKSFPFAGRPRGKALVPQVPLPLRPKRALQNYHVLFEAEWSMLPPVDPMLLRRVGRADLWVVCAAWDLTEVERMALAARVHA
jgi:hypothetical protein